MFYLTTHSTHFIYGYIASDIWLRTILIVRKVTSCCHIGYSYRLTARVLLYAPSHRQDNTYHGLCYTCRGALAGTRYSSMGPLHEGSIRRPIAPWANALPLSYVPLLGEREREREMFYLTMHSTHFIYGYMASDIWLRTILIVRKETRCRHIGYSYREIGQWVHTEWPPWRAGARCPRWVSGRCPCCRGPSWTGSSGPPAADATRASCSLQTRDRQTAATSGKMSSSAKYKITEIL